MSNLLDILMFLFRYMMDIFPVIIMSVKGFQKDVVHSHSFRKAERWTLNSDPMSSNQSCRLTFLFPESKVTEWTYVVGRFSDIFPFTTESTFTSLEGHRYGLFCWNKLCGPGKHEHVSFLTSLYMGNFLVYVFVAFKGYSCLIPLHRGSLEDWSIENAKNFLPTRIRFLSL